MKRDKTRRFVLRSYLWKRKFGYVPEQQTTDIGWTTVRTHGTITVPLKMLVCRIRTENGTMRVPIAETPHYRWVKDLVDGKDDSVSRQGYREYVEAFQSQGVYPAKSTEQQLSHVIDTVSLYKSDAEKSRSIVIITNAPKRKFNICPYTARVYDGVHRASIAMALGHRSIRCMVK